MADYTKKAASAKKLIEKSGGAVVLVRESGGSYNPITGATIAGSDASVTTEGVLTKYPNSMIDGTRILQGDRKLILSNSHEPLPTDRVTIKGEDWSIVGIEGLTPDLSTDIIYFVQVRK